MGETGIACGAVNDPDCAYVAVPNRSTAVAPGAGYIGRPPKIVALKWQNLKAVLRGIVGNDEARCVVLTGAGEFRSGSDLSARGDGATPPAPRHSRGLRGGHGTAPPAHAHHRKVRRWIRWFSVRWCEMKGAD